MARTYDLSDDGVVVVIGSGAGGGTVANELAQKGVDVVCLEAGSRLSLADVVNDPPAMEAKMGWHDKRGGAPVWLCKTVGGTTMRWSGVCPRFLDFEFRARTMYGPLGDTNLIDWPLTLEELEPYYDKAEAKIGLSGVGGRPPSDENNNFKVFKAGAERIGYRDITTSHIAINSVDYDGRPQCQEIGYCNYGCAVGAKWSTLYTEIPKAEATDHFELRPQSTVIKINHNDQGRVTGVVYVDKDGATQEQAARAVCVAGNVVETTRLLLMSETSMFPDGLANSSGHLGRNYMRHMAALFFAVMPEPVNLYRGAAQAGFVRDEHRHDPSRGFAGGYLMEIFGGMPEVIAAYGGWGENAAAWMEKYDHMAGLYLVGEDPPEAHNRIYLHETEKDEYGLPVPVLDYAEHENTVAMKHHAIEQSKKLYGALGGAEFRHSGEDPEIGCHNMGVARMSANPSEGVTNRWGQTHDIPNLFVSDGSLFSSSAAPNPTLTIVALAIRQADHIAGRMSRGEL